MQIWSPTIALLLLTSARAAPDLPDNARLTDRDPLGAAGEVIAGATLDPILAHPEFSRYTFRWPGGALTILEVTGATPGHEGVCTSGGATLFPRPDLAPPGAPPPPQPDPAPGGLSEGALMDAFCARLAQHPPALTRLPLTGAPPVDPLVDPPGGALPQFREARSIPWWVAVGGVLLPLLAPRSLAGWREGAIRRARLAELRGLLGWSAAALAWRLAVADPGIFNGGNAGYEKIRLALGQVQNNPYGDGFGWLLEPFFLLLGRTPDTIFTANLCMSALSAGLVWVWVRREQGGRAAAMAAGLVALLPVPVMLSRTEEMSVPVVLLALIALCAASASRAALRRPHGWTRGWAHGWIAGWALGLALHVRPEAALLVPAVALAALPPAPLRSLPSRLPALLTAALLLAAAVWLRLPVETGQQVLQWRKLLEPETLLHTWLPLTGYRSVSAFQTALHLRLTPPLLPLLALIGLAAAARADRLRWAGIWAALTLPVVIKAWPLADAIRLQHPALLPWLLAAGAGAARLPGPALLLCLLSLLPWAISPQMRWVNQEEYRFLAATVPALGGGRVIAPLTGPRLDRFIEVMEGMGPARWLLSTPDHPVAPLPQDRIWRGWQCATPGAPCSDLLSRCTLAPEQTLTLAPRSDLDVEIQGEVTIGFYRVLSCP